MKHNSYKFAPIILFIIIAIFLTVSTYIKSKEEYSKSYNFVIGDIGITPTKILVFYNIKGEEIVIYNYHVMEYDGVEIGDVVYKKKNSKYLYIYKRDDKGKFRIHLRIQPIRDY